LETLWDEAFEGIRRAYELGRLGQAYLLISPPHAELRRLLGRILGLLFCRADTGRRPCGHCPGCRQSALGVHPDVHFVEPKLKSRATAIEEIRTLIHGLEQTAYEGGWKAAVLWKADRMTDQAANALLKHLEEPPGRTLFLLQTDRPDALLPTIRSRCQTLRFPLETSDEMRQWMESVAELMSDSETGALAVWRRCARVAEIMGHWMETVRQEIDAESRTLPETPDHDVLEARVQSRYREGRWLFLLALLGWHRDLLAAVCGLEEEQWLFRKQAECIRRQAARLTPREVLRRLDIVESMNERLEQNLGEPAVWESGFAQLFSVPTAS